MSIFKSMLKIGGDETTAFCMVNYSNSGDFLVVLWKCTKSFTVEMKDAQGESVGTATFFPAGRGVGIRLDLKIFHPVSMRFISTRWRGVKGRVSKPPVRISTLAVSSTDRKIRWGPHAGDMNNFKVWANGTARVTITDPRVNLGTDSYSLFTGGGTSLVIHAKADDMNTDPSGNSGDRISCGVISK
jgi:Cu-Zn family superoxide dismutase